MKSRIPPNVILSPQEVASFGHGIRLSTSVLLFHHSAMIFLLCFLLIHCFHLENLRHVICSHGHYLSTF